METGLSLANGVNPASVATQFSFADGNVFVKVTDTLVFCVHASVLGRVSTYFAQVLRQADRMNGMSSLDMSGDSVANVQALLGAIYNIEG